MKYTKNYSKIHILSKSTPPLQKITNLKKISYFLFIELAVTTLFTAITNYQPKVAIASSDLIGVSNQGNLVDGNFEECNRLLEVDINNVEALLCRGNSRFKLGDKIGAIEDYSQALRLDPTNPEIYYQRSKVRDSMGDKEGAFDDYSEIIKLAHNYVVIAPEYSKNYLTLAYNKRGKILSELGQKQKAVLDFTASIDLNPDYDQPYLGRGSALAALGMKSEAEKDYSKYLLFNPTDATSYYNRGVIRYQLGNLTAALKDYKQAIKLNSNLASAYYNQGIVLDDLGYNDLALDSYEKALRLNRNIFMVNRPQTRGHHREGIVLVRLAERLVKQAEKRTQPEESTIGNYFCDAEIEDSVTLTQAYSQAESYYNEAINEYKEAIRLDPTIESFEYARAFRDRAYVYSRLGNHQAAKDDFNAAIQVKKKYAPAYFGRGCLRAESGDYQGAIDDYTLAIRYGKGENKKHTLAMSADPNPEFNKAESYYHRGQAYAKLNQHKKALHDYSEALERYHLPQAKAAKYHYARANSYYALRKYEKAKRDYTQFLSYLPNATNSREYHQIAEAYRKRADVRFELGEKQGAIEDYNYYAEVTGDKRTAAAYFDRGSAFREVGNLQGSANDYSQSLYYSADNLEAYQHRGNYRSDTMSIKEDNIPSPSPQPNSVTYNNRGLARRQSTTFLEGIARRQSLPSTEQENLRATLQDYERAINLNPNNPVPYNNRGVALAYLDESQQAISAFNEAIRLNPKYSEAYYNRGTVYDRLGQQQMAMRDYSKAISLNRKYAEAYYNRGILRYDSQDRNGAIADLQKAKDLLVKQGNMEMYRKAIDLLNKMKP